MLVLFILWWLSLAGQQAVAPMLSFWRFSPDFPIVALAATSLIVSRPVATIFGFALGIGYGALAGASITHYGVSRVLAGFAGGTIRSFRFGESSLVAAAMGAVLTLLAYLIFMFLAPPKGIVLFLGDTIRAAVYNGVLTVPVYAVLRRLLPSTSPEGGF
jgi:hypothetical protein